MLARSSGNPAIAFASPATGGIIPGFTAWFSIPRRGRYILQGHGCNIPRGVRNDSRTYGSRRRRVLLAFLLLTTAAPAFGQDASRIRVKSVRYEGLSRVNEAYVQDIVGVRAGDDVPREALELAVRRLLRTGRFVSARYDVRQDPDGSHVTFVLGERSIVTAVLFEGNSRFTGGQLLETANIPVNEPIDWFQVQTAADTIETKYRGEGYGDVTVTADRAHFEETGELIFRIDEGVRVRIREIEFEGNTAFEDKTLKKELSSKTAFWFFRSGAFNADVAEADASAVQKFYRDRGYLDARASYRRELSDDGEDLRLVFTIEEGEPYSIRRITFEGNEAFSTEELREIMTSKEGEVIQQRKVDADMREIQSRYWALGHIYVTIRPERTFAEEPGLVDLKITINEGGQFRVGKVVVRGNAQTKDKVVRRALDLYPPDDLLDLNEAREAEQQLVESRIFSSARVIPIGEEEGRRDVVIDVKEAERQDNIVFGLGITSDNGAVGSLTLDLQNFDLFDYPRSFSEFRQFRSFLGGGQRFRVELQPGTQVSRFRVDFTEPYLMDKPLRFDFSGYLFDRGRDGYNEQRAGMIVSLGKRFERGPLHGWSGELALRVEGVSIDDRDLFAARDIREAEGSHVLTSLKGTLLRDRTDSRFLPTEGDRLRLSYEQFGVLGGDESFGKAQASYTWYKTLSVDRLERKRVLRLHGEGGAIVGDAPVYERFYAGGIGSMRGFAFRGVGPHEGIDDNNVGGDTLLLLSAEYSFPLVGENVRGHVFADTGTVDSGTYRGALGVGLRMTIDVLGPVPLEFNLAFPVSSESEDDEQAFSFIIGTLF